MSPQDRKLFAGARLRRLRLQQALTQTRMAEDLGVSVSYLNLIERNQRPLTAAFLLKLASDDSAIGLAASDTPAFNNWRWVSYWYPVRKVVPFKRAVYVRALRELAPAMRRSRRENERA